MALTSCMPTHILQHSRLPVRKHFCTPLAAVTLLLAEQLSCLSHIKNALYDLIFESSNSHRLQQQKCGKVARESRIQAAYVAKLHSSMTEKVMQSQCSFGQSQKHAHHQKQARHAHKWERRCGCIASSFTSSKDHLHITWFADQKVQPNHNFDYH